MKHVLVLQEEECSMAAGYHKSQGREFQAGSEEIRGQVRMKMIDAVNRNAESVPEAGGKRDTHQEGAF